MKIFFELLDFFLTYNGRRIYWNLSEVQGDKWIEGDKKERRREWLMMPLYLQKKAGFYPLFLFRESATKRYKYNHRLHGFTLIFSPRRHEKYEEKQGDCPEFHHKSVYQGVKIVKSFL